MGQTAQLQAYAGVNRLEHVFVSHTHIDHFIGFDHLLRVLVGREKTIRLYGPNGLIGQVQHKLLAYRWNHIDRFISDLVFIVTEIDCTLAICTARLRLKNAFAAEAAGDGRLVEGVLYSERNFRVATAVLEHRTQCLGFSIEEAAHINVWKNRLSELGLPVRPWLRELKSPTFSTSANGQQSVAWRGDLSRPNRGRNQAASCDGVDRLEESDPTTKLMNDADNPGGRRVSLSKNFGDRRNARIGARPLRRRRISSCGRPDRTMKRNRKIVLVPHRLLNAAADRIDLTAQLDRFASRTRQIGDEGGQRVESETQLLGSIDLGNRTAGLFPGAEAALDVSDGLKPHPACDLRSQRRAKAAGAKEDEALVFGKDGLVVRTGRVDPELKHAARTMEGVRHPAFAAKLADVADINEHDIITAAQRQRLLDRDRFNFLICCLDKRPDARRYRLNHDAFLMRCHDPFWQ
jgi:hypothetical protein